MSSVNPAFAGPPQTIAFYGEGEYKKFTPQAAVFGVAAHEAENHRYFQQVAAASGQEAVGASTTFKVAWDPVSKRAMVVGGESRATMVKRAPRNGVKSGGNAVVVDPALDPNSPQNVQRSQSKKDQAQAAAVVAASRNKSKTPPADKNLLGRLSSQRARLASELTRVDTELSTRKTGQADKPPPVDGPVDAPPRTEALTQGMQPLPPAQPPHAPMVDNRASRADTVSRAAAAGSPEAVQARRAAAQQYVQAAARTRPALPDDGRVKDLEQRRFEIEQRLAHVDESLQKVSEDLDARLSGLMQGIVQAVEEQAGAVAQAALGMQPDMGGGAVEVAAGHSGGSPQVDVPMQSGNLPPAPVAVPMMPSPIGVGAPAPAAPERPAPLPTPTYNAVGRTAGDSSDKGFLINTSA